MCKKDIIDILKSNGVNLTKEVIERIPESKANKVKVLHSRRYGISIGKDWII